MPSPELEALVRTGLLTREPPRRLEIEGLLDSGSARLVDAQREELSLASRFDLAYNAAHALALAALRSHGYRTHRRYLVFQALPHTLGIVAPTWRVLAKAHDVRNRAEYEGAAEVDVALLAGLIDAGRELRERTAALILPPSASGGG